MVGCALLSSVYGLLHPGGVAMKVVGTMRAGFVLMNRVTVEIELPQPDTTHHRTINENCDLLKGKHVELMIEATL